jgi:hypothetical protein
MNLASFLSHTLAQQTNVCLALAARQFKFVDNSLMFETNVGELIANYSLDPILFLRLMDDAAERHHTILAGYN